LTLDSVILDALDSLMGSVTKRVDELAAARATRGAAGAGGAAPVSAGAPTGGETPGQPVSPPASPVAVEHPYFALDPGIGPFVPVAAASAYFPIGGFLSVDARYVIPTSSGKIAVGVSAAAIYFMAVGTIATAQDFLIPLGADVRYEIGNGAPILMFAHLSAGPALLVMATGSGGMLTDLTGYLRTGIGATYMFTPRVGLSFVVDYEIYFEMPYLIMGLTPQVAVSVKL
jgi:hypothetical protein